MIERKERRLNVMEILPCSLAILYLSKASQILCILDLLLVLVRGNLIKLVFWVSIRISAWMSLNFKPNYLFCSMKQNSGLVSMNGSH
jgi:hypothetical protein